MIVRFVPHIRLIFWGGCTTSIVRPQLSTTFDLFRILSGGISKGRNKTKIKKYTPRKIKKIK